MSEKDMEYEVLKSPFWNKITRKDSEDMYWHYQYGKVTLKEAYNIQKGK